MGELDLVLDAVIEIVRKVGSFQLEYFREMPEGVGDMEAVCETAFCGCRV